MFKNILANYIGRFWGFLSAFLFTPIYIHFLGVEGFSIISFSLVIAGFMSVLDAGLSATLSREFAIKSNSILDKEKTLSTFEWFYFGVSLFIILIIFIPKTSTLIFSLIYFFKRHLLTSSLFNFVQVISNKVKNGRF